MEYLIQGLNKGEVQDALTVYSQERAKEVIAGNWSTWFDEIRLFDVSDPLNPVFIGTKKI